MASPRLSTTSACVLALIVFSATCFISPSHGHSHDGKPCTGHGHAHEAPASKYSQEANAAHSHGEEASHGHSHESHGHAHSHGDEEVKVHGDCCSTWYKAMGSTLLISAAPFFILFTIDIDGSEEHKPFLNVLLAFAAGGLLGDAFLHLIPHAIPADSGEHDHGHAHSHGGDEGHGHSHNPAFINCQMWVLAGMLTFLIIEKAARVMDIGHSHSSGDGHSHGKAVKAKTSDDEGSDDEDEKKSDEKAVEATENTGFFSFIPQMEVSGYLNLFADFSHNFTDGLAIGASYLAGQNVGIITTITILVHEVPHEIGDFAILIQSGCPRMKAIWLQSSTAIGAMIGTLVGLNMGNIGEGAVNAILPFTAGGFIYIACVSVLPELLNSKYNSPMQVLKEFGALFTGIGMMVVIGWYE